LHRISIQQYDNSNNHQYKYIDCHHLHTYCENSHIGNI
jgi:hypothetical protein